MSDQVDEGVKELLDLISAIKELTNAVEANNQFLSDPKFCDGCKQS